MMLKQMRYFVAVVDSNSFTKAADACFISQSAISQQIAALEGELGVKLLERRGRSFSVTPAGAYFYRQGKDLLADIDAMCRETTRLGQDRELSLSIGYPRAFVGREIQEAVASFASTYPEVSIDVVAGNHEELYESLKAGDLDLAVNDQRRAFSDEYVNFELARCGCYVEISERNPAAAEDSLGLRELRRLPCILVASASQHENEQEYYRDTLRYRDNFLFAGSVEEGRLMVTGNRGFMPVECARFEEPSDPAIRRIPLVRDGAKLVRNYCAFWLVGRGGYYVEEFASLLKDKFQSGIAAEG